MSWPIEYVTSRLAKLGIGVKHPAQSTAYGSARVAQVEPSLLELARSGAIFGGVMNIVANAISPVQTLPTTSPTISLYNGEDMGGKTLVLLDAVHYHAGGTAGVGSSLWAAVSPQRIASPPSSTATGWKVGSLSGSRKTSAALLATSVTLPGTPVWHVLNGNTQAAATTLGSANNPYSVLGMIIIPPGYALGMDVVSGAGSSAVYGISLAWAELQLDLE